MRKTWIRQLLPNALTVATVGVITVADMSATGGVPWYKALAWLAVWLVVIAIVVAGSDRRR
ncbi:hypothetical protein OIU34_20895 [Pararhizobium sp. BT-229]|uniref:hypothetical protein n=1 Tax=Pararhizobium sp. BT-229 TaxID=2986923 RepID=UPI0021F70C90|nr:hypothetical protein [Pararhizobium sp. BT-229]MCV9964349.1 hypothetical protein [Pararhizobium sp. BT-229]